MTEIEAFELGNKLYANITSNANNIIKTNDYIDFIRIAINALEKQIVKKPIINYINTSEDATEIEYTCSVCGTNFVELTPCKEWCPYCGNKIDWSDEE